MEKEYEDFFEKTKIFKAEQQKQKQRGINDYNMVNVVRKENAEVGMHSNVIYSLIDPDGLHYQDDLFLNLFIENVLNIRLDDFGFFKSVDAEEPTDINRRIDFTIKSSKYFIGIEMKIDASDLDEQISHYYHDLVAKAKNDNIENVVIYYLTKNGKEASPNSHKGIDYEKISFEEHILNWIAICQNEVRNITNLNEALENYKDIVKKITGNYKGKVMSLKDELLKNEEYFKLAKDISEAFQEAQNEKINKLKLEKINLILEYAKTKGVNYNTFIPKFAMIDLVTEFTIRYIANEDHYLVQVFDKDRYGHDVDKVRKQKILLYLQTKVDNRFKSEYSKVYGQMTISYLDEKTNLDDLLDKLIGLKEEI